MGNDKAENTNRANTNREIHARKYNAENTFRRIQIGKYESENTRRNHKNLDIQVGKYKL